MKTRFYTFVAAPVIATSLGLLAFAVMILAIVQIGAAIVLIPVIIWIWTDKDFTTALLLTLFLGIVGVLDNILKPLVMGRGARSGVHHCGGSGAASRHVLIQDLHRVFERHRDEL